MNRWLNLALACFTLVQVIWSLMRGDYLSTTLFSIAAVGFVFVATWSPKKH